MEARIGGVVSACLCLDKDFYSFPTNVDSTSRTSIAIITPFFCKIIVICYNSSFLGLARRLAASSRSS